MLDKRFNLVFSPPEAVRNLTVHRLEKSRSQRILWLFEELKIDYELKTFKRVNMLAPAELKEVHPLGKSPVVTIEAEGMSKPLVLAESGLIVEYFVDHFGTWLAPKRYVEGNEGQAGAERDEWIRYRYFMHYTEGSITPLLVIALLMSSKSLQSFDKTASAEEGMSRHQEELSVLHQADSQRYRWANRLLVFGPQFRDPFQLSRKPDIYLTGWRRLPLWERFYRCRHHDELSPGSRQRTCWVLEREISETLGVCG